MRIIQKTNKIQVICPICKTRDLVGIPRSQLNNKSQLTTISIQKGLICPHHFQFFIDNQFQIRGYQKVDLELNKENSKNLSNGVKVFSESEEKNNNLFENVIFDGEKVQFSPLKNDPNKEIKNFNCKTDSKSKKMTLEEIYEEFWEFIDSDNVKFHKFIVNDLRRRDLVNKYQTNNTKDHLIYESI